MEGLKNFNENMGKNVCFSGHRSLLRNQWPKINAALDEQLKTLHETGTKNFFAGGAVGFDTLAAFAVLRLRQKAPDVRLVLVLPCANQSKYYTPAQKMNYQRILKYADEIICLSENYYSGCMHARNRYMIDHAAICLCYMTHTSGGTAYTVRYAARMDKKIINLAAI